MGKFIESLHRKIQQGNIDAQREADSVLKAARKEQLEIELVLRKRAENKPQWEEAKRQFGESGLFAIFGKVVDLGGAESYYVDPESFDKIIYWKESVGRPYFYAELNIKTIVKEHDEHYYVGGYSNKITTKYVGIETDKDGVISFRGKRGPFGLTVRVPKTKWQKNVGVLENALGRVYHHSLTSERREMIGNPYFDNFGKHLTS